MRRKANERMDEAVLPRLTQRAVDRNEPIFVSQIVRQNNAASILLRFSNIDEQWILGEIISL